MTDLTELPFPSGSPHFKMYDGEFWFVTGIMGKSWTGWRPKYRSIFNGKEKRASPHERTIICAVAEAWFRRKAEELQNRRAPADVEIGFPGTTKSNRWYFNQRKEVQNALFAAHAWAAAGSEKE